jgi:hypothetical protein
MYLNENRHYPKQQIVPAFDGAVPLAQTADLINSVGRYLGWTQFSGNERIDELPQIAVCNVRREVTLLDDPYPPAVFGLSFWLTGYAYWGGLMEARNGAGTSTAVALANQSVPDHRGKRRGVIWSDYMILLKSGSASNGWAYFHFKGSHEVNPVFVTAVTPRSYRGHHRAWTDGSVEWLKRGDFSLHPDDAETGAIHRVGTPALTMYTY